MIFHIPTSFLQKIKSPDLSDLAYEMARNGHFIKVDKDGYRMIRDAVREHGSTNQKECFFSHTEIFDISTSLFSGLRNYWVDENSSVKDLRFMVTEPARLVTENANHEWPVYKHLIDVYRSDPKYGDLFAVLKKAKDNHRITGDHAGGSGELLKTMDRDAYLSGDDNLRLLKTCVLFDRDTDDDTYFDGHKNSLFRRFVGKDHTTISDNDIYTLSHDVPVWHMWYKRAIENYIPNEQYVYGGFDISGILTLTNKERDYALLGGNGSTNPLIAGYDKKALPGLIAGLSRSKIERNLKHFNINGEDLSEMQLFLLKLVKTI